MMNQNKTKQVTGNAGFGAKLKLKRSPVRGDPSTKKPSCNPQKELNADQLNFTHDMKRIGIMADIQGVKENQKKLIIKCRHISPPPYLNGTSDKKESTQQTEGQNKKTQDEDVQSTSSKLNIKSNSLFKFPFQRRARSLSLPKDEEGNDIIPDDPDKKSIGNNPNEKATYESRQNFTIASGQIQNKHSPIGKDEISQNNRPVIAKDNFVLAHKNLIPGVKKLLKQQQDAEIMMGHCKEVEEWLMGSGES
jgi:hypothetical protein